MNIGRRGLLTGFLTSAASAALAAPFGSKMRGKGRGTTVPPEAPPPGDTLTAGDGWDGSTGGWGGAYEAIPTANGVSDITPSCHLLNVPYQTISGQYTLCATSGASTQNKLDSETPRDGIAGVDFYCNGAKVTSTTEDWVNYTDVNGIARTMFGFVCTLDCDDMAARFPDGMCQIYIVSRPTDPGKVARVIGPFEFYPRVSTAYEYTVNVDVTQGDDAGIRYNSIQKALAYLAANNKRHSRVLLTNMGSGTYIWSGSPTSSFGLKPKFWTTVECDAGVTVSIRGNDATAIIGFDGIHWKGAGITFDTSHGNMQLSQTRHQLWCDGIGRANSQALFTNTKFSNPGNWWSYYPSSARPDSVQYYTDCDPLFGTRAATLIRNCTVRGEINYPLCIHGLTQLGLDPTNDRDHTINAAITVSSPTSRRLKVSGPVNQTTPRTATLYESDGVTVVATFTLNATVGGGNHTFEDLKGFLDAHACPTTVLAHNAVDGFGAERRAMCISHVSVSPLTALWPSNGIELSPTGTTFSAVLDSHLDHWQDNGEGEVSMNVDARFMTMDESVSCQVIFWEPITGGFSNKIIRNSFARTVTAGAGDANKFNGTNTHLVVWGCTFMVPNIIDTAWGGGTHCWWHQNYMDHMSGTDVDFNNVKVSKNYFRTNIVTTGDKSNNIGPTGAATSTIFQDPAAYPVLPIDGGPLEVSGQIIGRWKPNGTENTDGLA